MKELWGKVRPKSHPTRKNSGKQQTDKPSPLRNSTPVGHGNSDESETNGGRLIQQASTKYTERSQPQPTLIFTDANGFYLSKRNELMDNQETQDNMSSSKQGQSEASLAHNIISNLPAKDEQSLSQRSVSSKLPAKNKQSLSRRSSSSSNYDNDHTRRSSDSSARGTRPPDLELARNLQHLRDEFLDGKMEFDTLTAMLDWAMDHSFPSTT